MWLLSNHVQLTQLLLKLDHLTPEPLIKPPYFTPTWPDTDITSLLGPATEEEKAVRENSLSEMGYNLFTQRNTTRWAKMSSESLD